MSLESILAHILNQAGAQREKIIREAKKEAGRIIQEAGLKAEELSREIIKKEKADCESQKLKLIINARMESKKNLLKIKQELIDEVFKQLKSEIKKDNIKKYQILHDKTKEVPEDIDFYLNNARLKYESELARILYA